MPAVQTALTIGFVLLLAACVLPLSALFAATGALKAVEGRHKRLDRIGAEAGSLRKHVRDLREARR